MERYYEDDFKGRDSSIIVSKRFATSANPGCQIHLHEYIEFYYVVKGGVHVYCSGSDRWINSGDIAFINWCQPHRSLKFKDDTTYYIIQFDLNSISCGNKDVFQSKFVSKLINDMDIFKSFYINDAELKKYFEQLVYEYEQKDFSCELSVQASIYNILAYIFKTADKTKSIRESTLSESASKYSKSIIQYIYVHYADEIDLNSMSRSLGISPSYM